MTNLKKLGVLTLSIALAAATIGCNNKEGKPAEVKSPNLPEAGKAEAQKIAYIEVDSLMTQYTFCLQYKDSLTNLRNSYQRTVENKMRALQQAGASFQKKIQDGTFTTQEQVQKAQASLAKQEQDLQKLQEDLTLKFDAEQAKFNQALRDSLQNFLADYNKKHKYTLILSKAGDNILYAAPSMDITADVIAGLNKRYKK